MFNSVRLQGTKMDGKPASDFMPNWWESIEADEEPTSTQPTDLKTKVASVFGAIGRAVGPKKNGS